MDNSSLTEKNTKGTNCVPKYTLADFTYDLPEELIAQKPCHTRDESRLMLINRHSQSISHHKFSDLPDLLSPGDLVIVNDTKVIPARLICERATGGLVEILLLHPEGNKSELWQAMGSPLKKLKIGDKLKIKNQTHFISIENIVVADDGQKRLIVNFGNKANVYTILSQAGQAPLPPYIHRNKVLSEHDREDDIDRYQTIFANSPGAVAAPTAGLHFSSKLINKLNAKNIDVKTITLHVGPGTFKPITSSLEEHTIETEALSINALTAKTINEALKQNRRIIAVGTTSCRALETAGMSGTVEPIENGSSSLYICPGFEFKIIKGLITNFHLSKSSLLVLVSAFAGHKLIMQAYEEAINERYRFFSYGDAMIIL
jgi:S-adenosylmethionine:tRNA ribosyltransferase-isomerase